MTEPDETRVDSDVESPPSGGLAGGVMRGRIAARMFGTALGPSRIARFEVTESIGFGGMGAVYLAHDPELGRKVALKLLHPAEALAEVDKQRLLREAQALAKLSHPNVVQLYEVGTHDEQVFLAMEYVRGMSLKEWQAHERPERSQLLAYYLQAGQGLAAAHEAELVHRDFKPANVLVGEDGRVRVADFGLARGAGLPDDSRDTASASPVPTITRPGTVMGTPAYMSPEQFRGDNVGPQSDQFSFCVSLWEALYGGRPFRGTELRAASLPPPRADRLPRADRIAPVLRRGLARTPEDRWPSMQTLLTALRAAARPRKDRWLWGGALVGLGCAVGVAMNVQTDRCPPAEVLRESLYSSAEETSVSERLREARYEQKAGALVTEGLEQYVDQWAAHRQALCHSGRRLGPPDVQQQARACLEHAGARLRRTVQLLTDPQSDAMPNAHRLVGHLDRLDLCTTPEQLAVASRLPTDEAAALSVTAVYRKLAEVDTLLDAGAWRSAEELLTTAQQDAEDIAHSSLDGWIDATRGRVSRAAGDIEEARKAMDSGVLAAQREDDPRLLVRTLIDLASLEAREFTETGKATSWLELAEATATRLPKGDPLHAELGLAHAAVLRIANEPAGALEVLDTLLAQAPAHALRQRVQKQRAHALSDVGQTEDARRTYEELLRVARDRFGERHPDVLDLQHDLSLLFRATGSHVEAARWADAALTTAQALFDPTSVRLAPYLTAAAEMKLATGLLDEGRELASLAWALQRDQLPTAHDERGSALALLAAHSQATGDSARALSEYRELADVWQDNPQGVLVDNNVAWTLCMQGDCAASTPYATRMLQRLGDGAALRRHARFYLAWGRLEAGDAAAARDSLDVLLSEVSGLPAGEADELIAEAGAVRGLAMLAQSEPRREWEPVIKDALAKLDKLADEPLRAGLKLQLKEHTAPTCAVAGGHSQKEIVALLKVFGATHKDTIQFLDNIDLSADEPREVPRLRNPSPTHEAWTRLQCLLRQQSRTMLHGFEAMATAPAASVPAARIAEATVLILGEGAVDRSAAIPGRTQSFTVQEPLCAEATALRGRELADVDIPPLRTSCTGVRVGPNQVLTLRHCAIVAPFRIVFGHTKDNAHPQARDITRIECEDSQGNLRGCAVGETCCADFEMGEEESLIPKRQFLKDCEGFLSPRASTSDDSWMLLTFENDADDRLPIAAPLGADLIDPREHYHEGTVTAMGHPRGLYRLRTLPAAVLSGIDDDTNRASIRTAPGMSGAPIYGGSPPRVVGLLKRPEGAYDYFNCHDDGSQTVGGCKATVRCMSSAGCGESSYAPIRPLVDGVCRQLSDPKLPICPPTTPSKETP